MIFILTIIALAQSFVGSYTVYAIYQRVQASKPSADPYPPLHGSSANPPEIGIIIFCIVLLIGLAFLAAKLRGFDAFLGVGIFLETVLAPIAIVRPIVGFILCLVFKATITTNMYEFNNEALDIVIGYLFYANLDTDGEVSRVTNFFTQLLICLPVIAAAAYCAYRLIHGAANSCADDNPLTIYFWMMGSTFMPFLYCSIRKQPTEVITGFDRNFKFKHSGTGLEYSAKADGNYYLEPTDEAREAGWERVSGGYTSAYTPRFIFTILLSPIIALTQVIGIIFAFIGIFCPHIYSCYGMVDFDDVRLPFLQRILHFFFSFVIV